MNVLLTSFIVLQRHENADDGEVPSGPHVTLIHKCKDIFKDASNLIIHHVKRQTGMLFVYYKDKLLYWFVFLIQMVEYVFIS